MMTCMKMYLLFLCWLILLSHHGSAVEYLEIDTPQIQPISLGIQTHDPSVELIAQELQHLLEKQFFFQEIHINAPEDHKSDWMLILSAQNDRIEWNLHKSSVLSKVDWHSRMTVLSPTEQSRAVWKMADDLVLHLVGVRGIAQTQLAFTFYQQGTKKQIGVTDFGGKELGRFSYNLYDNRFPFWGNEDKWIFYTSFTGSGTALSLQPRNRLQSELIEFSDLQLVSGGWQFQKKNLLLSAIQAGKSNIYSFDLYTKKLKKLTKNRKLETTPVASKDGKMIAWVSGRIHPRYPQIYLRKTGETKAIRITQANEYHSSPKWSPDGKFLVYEKMRNGYLQVFLYELKSKTHRQLTFENFNSEKPEWSPNGQQFVISAQQNGIYKLYYLSLDGKQRQRVTTLPKYIHETDPAWSGWNAP